MQVSDPEQLLDCLSAQELLNALKILKKINDKNQELELSFNESSTSMFNTVGQQQQQNIDFQLYMAKKQQKKVSNTTQKQRAFTKKPKPTIKQSENQNKSVSRSPFKSTAKQAVTPRQSANEDLAKLKSRSHSPIAHSTTPSKSFEKFYQRNMKYRKTDKQNVPTCETQQPAKNKKISEKSKQILQARERKGDVYIPIHQRQNKVIKEKQQKIAKLQRINMTQKELEERQCTFKPTINQYKNPVASKVTAQCQSSFKNRRRGQTSKTINDHSQIQNNQFSQSNIYIQNNQTTFNIDSQKEEDDYQISNISLDKIEPAPTTNHRHTKSTLPQRSQKQAQKPKPTKYKNSKFNMLLDLIS